MNRMLSPLHVDNISIIFTALITQTGVFEIIVANIAGVWQSLDKFKLKFITVRQVYNKSLR
jgi:nucleoside recognition membrane protein YjiH